MRGPLRRLGIGEAMLAVVAVAGLLASVRAVWVEGIALAVVGPLALHRARAQWRIDRAAARPLTPGRLAAIGLTASGMALLLVVASLGVGSLAAAAAAFLALVVSGRDLPAELDLRGPMRIAGVVWLVVTLATAWRLGPALWPRAVGPGREGEIPPRGNGPPW
jgi:hypothetical protein